MACSRENANFFPNKTRVQCLHQWKKVLNPEIIKGPWTQEEDDYITSLVAKYGPSKWSTIVKSLPKRIGKQCRERQICSFLFVMQSDWAALVDLSGHHRGLRIRSRSSTLRIFSSHDLF